MIAEYFDRGKEATGVVEYFLDEKRVADGTAFVLRGNPEVTKFLIKSNKNKLKYRSGVLAFTENEMDGKTKEEIMDLFERSTFAGLKKWQYNILWVQHHDKANGRIELNFIIPRLELSSGKAFNPHYFKEDQKRLLLLRDVINNEYKFTLPHKKENRQTLITDKKWTNGNKKKEALHGLITGLINQGEVVSRDDVISYLSREGYKINRTSNPKNISIEKDGTKMRMEGTFYCKAFTSLKDLDTELQKVEDKHTHATVAELTELKAELERFIDYKAKTTMEKYPRPEPKEQDRSEIIKFEEEDKLDEQDIKRVVDKSREERANRNRRIREREERARKREEEVLRAIREHGNKVFGESIEASESGDRGAVSRHITEIEELSGEIAEQVGEFIENEHKERGIREFSGTVRDLIGHANKLIRGAGEFVEQIGRVGKQVGAWLENAVARQAKARNAEKRAKSKQIAQGSKPTRK